MPLIFSLSLADLCKCSFLMNKTNNRAAMKSSGEKRHVHIRYLLIMFISVIYRINNFLFNFASPIEIQQVQRDMKTDITYIKYWILKILIPTCTS